MTYEEMKLFPWPKDVLTMQSHAWFDVCEALDETVGPSWIDKKGSASELAVETIHGLALNAARYVKLRDALISNDPYALLNSAFSHLDHNQVPTADDFDKGIDTIKGV
jgi:hypothetical protein